MVDGAAFVELTESDVKELVKALGLVKRIMRLQQQIKSESSHNTSVVSL